VFSKPDYLLSITYQPKATKRQKLRLTHGIPSSTSRKRKRKSLSNTNHISLNIENNSDTDTSEDQDEPSGTVNTTIASPENPNSSETGTVAVDQPNATPNTTTIDPSNTITDSSSNALVIPTSDDNNTNDKNTTLDTKDSTENSTTPAIPTIPTPIVEPPNPPKRKRGRPPKNKNLNKENGVLSTPTTPVTPGPTLKRGRPRKKTWANSSQSEICSVLQHQISKVEEFMNNGLTYMESLLQQMQTDINTHLEEITDCVDPRPRKKHKTIPSEEPTDQTQLQIRQEKSPIIKRPVGRPPLYRGRGRPPGSKNKNKLNGVTAGPKRPVGRPPGSKNKKKKDNEPKRPVGRPRKLRTELM